MSQANEYRATEALFQKNIHILDTFFNKLRTHKIIKKIPPNAHVLDLGCGYDARLLRGIANRISGGYGVDLFINEKFTTGNIHLAKHDLNDHLPFLDNTFDVVVSLANLEHLNNPEGSLQNIWRVLKPGGILLLTTPTVYAKPVLEFLAFKLGLINKDGILDHKQYFIKKSLLEICKRASFSTCQHKYFELFMNNYICAIK